jgi:EAL domain-containing protein (putative c-di-GMP-specific phosphodiesterase class I)
MAPHPLADESRAPESLGPKSGQAPEGLAAPRVLVVDDDERVLRLHQRVLAKAGFEVETALSGEAAMALLHKTWFDVVLSDIDMPGMNGIRLLERVRAHDVDVPVILITGAPSMETAVQALDRGALRYLAKPTDLTALVQVTNDAVRLHRLAIAKRQALAIVNGTSTFSGDLASLAVSFERALAGVSLAYQPIISWQSRSVVGYEALLRSAELSLPNPGAVLDAAERLDRVHDLGRHLRGIAVAAIDSIPGGADLFVNLHPLDLIDNDLLDRDSLLGERSGRITLEVTERTSLDRLRDVRARIRSIRDIGFRFALDDFGAGFGGLTSFALLEPDIVKLDMGLIRGIEREPTKQTLVRTMIKMCEELGILVIAEGVETAEERDELVRSGCDLMQGYLFARPSETFPAPTF